jgi:hypothetical protein
VKKLIDRLQIWLYLSGFTRLGQFVGRWGTAPLLLGSSSDDRPTLPDPVPNGEVRSGPGWALDEFEVGPLKVINFDPAFNDNKGVDTGRDVAFPTTKYDVN